MISMRTKEALQALKRKGKKLGNPRTLLQAQRKGAASTKEASDIFAASTLPIIEGFRHQGLTLRRIAQELNSRGVPTLRGGEWHASTLVKIVKRAKNRFEHSGN